jgi:peptidoglycan/xylan/chitin deacetylase (PgdA/CDA1 family)
MEGKKFFWTRIISSSILLFIFILASWSAGIAIKDSLSDDSNISYVFNLLNPCKPFKNDSKENKVVLRIDDIQAFAWQDISIEMMKDALSREMPLVLGVIPNGIINDKEIFSYLRRNNCNIEIAQHGWSHDLNAPEFEDLQEEEAYEKIMKGKEILEKITDEPITTFIPPNNIYSSGTATALEKAGFKAVSAEGDGYFDYTTFTYNLEEDKYTPVSQIISECQGGFDKNNLCIIMIHPQDYLSEDGKLDRERYKNYLVLLDEVEKMDAEVVKMKDLIGESQDNLCITD